VILGHAKQFEPDALPDSLKTNDRGDRIDAMRARHGTSGRRTMRLKFLSLQGGVLPGDDVSDVDGDPARNHLHDVITVTAVVRGLAHDGFGDLSKREMEENHARETAE
jgi:hypothetical protein